MKLRIKLFRFLSLVLLKTQLLPKSSAKIKSKLISKQYALPEVELQNLTSYLNKYACENIYENYGERMKYFDIRHHVKKIIASDKADYSNDLFFYG